MKLPKRVVVVIHFSVLFCILALTSSCNNLNNKPSNETGQAPSVQPELFLVSHDTHFFWIFNVNIDIRGNLMAEPIYQIPSVYPPSALPPDEQALLSNCSANANAGCVLPNVALQHGIDDLTISPDQKYLVWRENTNYCPTNGCLVGTEQLFLWNVAAKDRQELAELPLNVSYGTQHISDISWSSDGQYVSFIHASKELGWSRLEVIQIPTGKIIDTVENVYHYAWSPYSNRIAYTGWEYLNHERRAFTRIETIGYQSPVSFYNDWVDIRNATWSPDGKRIAVIALQNKNLQTGKWGLYVIDLERQAVVDETSLDSQGLATVSWAPRGNKILIASYTQKNLSVLDVDSGSIFVTKNNSENFFGLYPSWSLSGKIIAVNTYPNQDRAISNGIAFVNANDGNLLNWLDLEGVSDNWVWLSSDDQIALNLQNKAVSCPDSKQRGIGLYDLQSQEFVTASFDQQMTSEILNCTMIIDELY